MTLRQSKITRDRRERVNISLFILCRAPSRSSSEGSNSSSEACTSVTVEDQDSAFRAAIHMKPRGLGGSGKPHLPNIGGHVNSLEQAQAEWKLVENLQKGTKLRDEAVGIFNPFPPRGSYLASKTVWW